MLLYLWHTNCKNLIKICSCSLSLCPCFASGAGQDVGRSCILVSIAGKNVMLDCGMHMGYNDDVS